MNARDMLRLRFVTIGVLWVLTPCPSAGQTPSLAELSERIREQVRVIAAADEIRGRRQAIEARVEALGLEPELVWFEPPPSAGVGRLGANIVAEVSGGSEGVLLLGAHYDRVERGRGVIDNAAGVAAVLELADAFVRRPLEHFGVELALFDLEEDGRLGSRAMVSDSVRRPLPAMFLNVDIFGYGGAFWIGSADPVAPLPQAVEAAGREAGIEVIVDSMYPSSDHVSFRRTSTRSFAISLLDPEDIQTLLSRFRGGARRGGETPKIFRIMHTKADTLDKLDAVAVARGVRALEMALRNLDADRGRR